MQESELLGTLLPSAIAFLLIVQPMRAKYQLNEDLSWLLASSVAQISLLVEVL